MVWILLQPVVGVLWAGFLVGYVSGSWAAAVLASALAMVVLYWWRQIYQPRKRPPGY